ncbi:hypothetical protein NQ317_015633 [Molorchus minor]|uniref:Peptidase A2 domain-containing protein n=1 Tax=Molorchus minor TaxID=1323400 RepID=A0ABQ9JUB5_9CUCU|nr:hypothetical protein NQ317_015633 [Molorchus minor]
MKQTFFSRTDSSPNKCNLCDANHLLFTCPVFKSKSPHERFSFCKGLHLCFNCLSHMHDLKACKSAATCKTCGLRHHTLLHLGYSSSSNTNNTNSAHPEVPQPRVHEDLENQPSTSHSVSLASTATIANNYSKVLLSTALIEVCDKYGNYHTCKALLDSGSQVSIISQNCYRRLNLKHFRPPFAVHGLGQAAPVPNLGAVTIRLKPVGQLSPVFICDALILPKICDKLPSSPVSVDCWSHLDGLRLADPNFYCPRDIDILLGADIYPQILLEVINVNSFFISASEQDTLNASIQKFWEIQNVPEVHVLSPEDQMCETMFTETCQRDNFGRFVVSLPFREPSPTFLDIRFELRKWSSNDPSFLSIFPESHLSMNPLSFDREENSLMVLGLQWSPPKDCFLFHIVSVKRTCTKRHVLSELAKVFDPLGIIAPVIFFTKHLIQRMWISGAEWDDPPSEDICRAWSQYQSELPLLSQICLPRRLILDNFTCLEIHGFSDASSHGYGAVIYFRVCDELGNFSTFFVCAKSKVAPLKRISISRLELCAALLLAKLISFVCKVYETRLKFNQVYAWSDSQIALSWIKSSPHRWKTFVSNRVSAIQDRIDPTCWYYVESQNNPADPASRGLFPHELVQLFLNQSHLDYSNFPPFVFPPNIVEEERASSFAAFVGNNFLQDLLERYASFASLQRIVAYILRFKFNTLHPTTKTVGPLSTAELSDALLLLVRHTQTIAFSSELKNRSFSKPLKKLNVFLDNDLLRVGGSLGYSALSYDKRYPLLLPRSSRLTELIIDHFHKKISSRRNTHNSIFIVTKILDIVFKTRYSIGVRLHRDFWQRWHQEYLHTLQQRSKWLTPDATVHPDTLVLIKDDGVAPLQWSMGRILELHPARDGIARVATVKTSKGIVKRPLVKLCPLPVDIPSLGKLVLDLAYKLVVKTPRIVWNSFLSVLFQEKRRHKKARKRQRIDRILQKFERHPSFATFVV